MTCSRSVAGNLEILEILCYHSGKRFKKCIEVLRMFRVPLYVCAAVFLSALFLSCQTAPVSSSRPSLVRYGAGSVEDDGSTVNLASPPGGIRKVRADEVIARVTVLESDLDAHLAAHDLPGAISAFDSISSLLAGIPAGTAKVAECRAKLDAGLDSIGFEAVSVPGETVAGTAFKKDFAVRVFIREGDAKKPLPGFLCTVYYPALSPEGNRVMLAESRTSGADGLVSFTAQVPSRSGGGNVVFAAALTASDPSVRDAIEARKNKGQLACAIAHNVATNAKTFPTTISILDYDRAGKPILSSNSTATALLMPLVQKGFRPIGMADFPKELAAGDEAALLKAAKAQFGSGVRRFIYGTTTVESAVQNADGLWACTVVAKVAVWDFTLGAEVYRTAIRDSETAKTEAAAVSAARSKLAGDLLMKDLYYNM
jgi:hypothetical protein